MKQSNDEVRISLVLLIGKAMGNLLSVTVIFLKWGFDEMLKMIEKFSIEVIPRVFQNTRYFREKRIEERAVKSYVEDISNWKGTDFTPYE